MDQLTPKQVECLNLMFSHKKITQNEIADILGVTRATISAWKRSKKFKAAFDNLINQQLQDIAPRALDTLIDLLHAESEKIRLDAAQALLDRAGYTKENKISVGSHTPVVIQNDLKDKPATDPVSDPLLDTTLAHANGSALSVPNIID